MSLINANEAAQAAKRFHEDQQRKLFETMQSFAENELAAMIAHASHTGHYRVTVNLPEHVSFNTLREYLTLQGYALERGSNGTTCLVSWCIE
jgi:hypothetical protein